MDINAHIDTLRKKPVRVRVRILVLVLIVALAGLVVLWVLTFRASRGETAQFFKDVSTKFSQTVANPAYKSVFPMGSGTVDSVQN